MADLEKLLLLFDDEKVRIMLQDCFNYAFSANSSLATHYLESLINLKRDFPNFSIDFSDDSSSYFDSLSDRIVISSFNISPIIFFHEVTHAFHFYRAGFGVPSNFSSLKGQLISSSAFSKKSVDLISDFIEKRSSFKFETADDMCDYYCLLALEDIIDALTDGKVKDRGLFFETSIDCIPKRSGKAAGHGSSYYTDEIRCFVEILASFSSIKFSKKRDLYFEILCGVIGQEMFDLISKYADNLFMGSKKKFDFKMK